MQVIMKTTFLSTPLLTSLIMMALGFVSCLAVPSAGPRPTQQAASSGFKCPEPEFDMDISSRELNILARAKTIPADIMECFELVYGIQLNVHYFTSDEEMYIRLFNNGIIYDVIQPSSFMTPLLIKNEKLHELNYSKMPFFDNLNPAHLNLTFDPGNKFTIPYQAGSYGIVYNTKTVDQQITSWKDLWDEKYAQRMIMPDNGRTVIGASLLTLGYDVNTLEEKQMQAAQDKLWELVPNIQIFDGETPNISLLSGKVDIGIIESVYALDLQAENPAFKFIYPSEGTILWQDNWAISSMSRHQDAAYAWLNYAEQSSVSWLALRENGTINPNLAAVEYTRDNERKLYEAYVNSELTNILLDVWQNGYMLIDAGEQTTFYNNIWVAIKGE